MRKPDPFYALGKFGEAVYALATEPGDVRSRLYPAFICLLPVRADDLPPALGQDLEWVTEKLTSKKSRFPEMEGDLLATLRSIRNSTGVKVAKRIVTIESRLRGVLYAERRRGKSVIVQTWPTVKSARYA